MTASAGNSSTEGDAREEPSAPFLDRDREFHIILWGATGFAGRFAAEYLARRYFTCEEPVLPAAFCGAQKTRKKPKRVGDGGRASVPSLVSPMHSPAITAGEHKPDFALLRNREENKKRREASGRGQEQRLSDSQQRDGASRRKDEEEKRATTTGESGARGQTLETRVEYRTIDTQAYAETAAASVPQREAAKSQEDEAREGGKASEGENVSGESGRAKQREEEGKQAKGGTSRKPKAGEEASDMPQENGSGGGRRKGGSREPREGQEVLKKENRHRSREKQNGSRGERDEWKLVKERGERGTESKDLGVHDAEPRREGDSIQEAQPSDGRAKEDIGVETDADDEESSAACVLPQALTLPYASRRREHPEVRFAFAGRSMLRLRKLRSSLADRLGKNCMNIDLLEADSLNEKEMETLCKRARVVLSACGPYKLCGEALVKACLAAKTHYCDISAEVSYVADMAFKYGQEAAARGLKFVSFCGVDSLPSDLAVLLIQREALKRRKIPCHEIKTAVTDCFGGFSGGTVMGLGHIFEEGAVFDPFFLVKYATPSPPTHLDLSAFSKPQIFLARYDENFGYCAYNVMAPINENVVRFSTVLQGLYPVSPALGFGDYPAAKDLFKSDAAPTAAPCPSSSQRPAPAGAPPARDRDGREKTSEASGSSPESASASARSSSSSSPPSCRLAQPGAGGLASSPCWPYPSFLHYSESVALGYDIISASVVSIVTFVLMFLVTFSLTRVLLTTFRFFPRPGEGPPRQFLDKGHFEIKVIGRVRPLTIVPSPDENEDIELEEGDSAPAAEDDEEAEEDVERRRYNHLHHHHKETVITVTIGSSLGDPGYKETGRMLVETGLAIALQLNACTDLCGVCTPASGVGVVLKDRLVKAGMSIELKSKQF
ncbi:hypothetical protein BESB_079170 [Besnoitia besnoiti]|uniref:Saccharopine dehydrogenase NADP binding domain-containing protein n=1 Tax=Besnoitia besnoiti TaxID=94643 RepID=A0A2A9MBL1_BESBE|nr:hypothetical protein BESB_079170 [Besnoitia besnoiti]PFH33701.1 hypothetical protein BESB_079170 [Besnoitia besnoiti]